MSSFVFLCMFAYAMTNMLSCHMFLCSQFRYDFRIKLCSVRFYLQLFVGGLIHYLRYLCLFAHSGVPWRVSYKRKELITFRRRLGSPRFLVGSVWLIFLVFCLYISLFLNRRCRCPAFISQIACSRCSRQSFSIRLAFNSDTETFLRI